MCFCFNSLFCLNQTCEYNDSKSFAEGLRARLLFANNAADITELIKDSVDNWRTRQYDWFQHATNQIMP